MHPVAVFTRHISGRQPSSFGLQKHNTLCITGQVQLRRQEWLLPLLLKVDLESLSVSTEVMGELTALWKNPSLFCVLCMRAMQSPGQVWHHIIPIINNICLQC
jgi:hypothetical protein